MKRNYEGTTRLQGIGIVEGIKAKNIKVGDVLVWNFGGTSEVVGVEFSKTGKTLKVFTKWFNKHSKIENGEWVGAWEIQERKMTAERIVVVKELNPVEEVAVEVEAEASEEVAVEEVVEVQEVRTERKERKTAFQIWIETFIEEKGLDLDHSFTIEHDGMNHYVSLGFLVKAMIKAPRHEQKQIKNKIVYIDFKNGDVMHFFDFLAGAYIKTNY